MGKVDGKDVLVKEGQDKYRLDNKKIKSAAPGIAFRKSKNLDDKDGSMLCRWGDIIDGTDVGDGWIKTKADPKTNASKDDADLVLVDILARVKAKMQGSPTALFGQLG